MMGGLGARVAIASRSEERVDAAAESLAAEGVEVFAHTCDIRDLDSIEALLDALEDKWGGVNALINNAGGQFPAPAQYIKPKGWDAVVRNNLNGTFYMTQAIANRFLIPNKAGVIVNIIANVFRGFPGMAHTGAARAGVDNLTKTLAVEWCMHGVRINAVAPGVIDSSGMDQYPPELVAAAKKAIPMKRLGTCEEVADLVTFLTSDLSRYITGETVYVDGGNRLWGSTWHIPDP
jgi:citronellol/citronellal dehydrogenase